MFAKDYNVGKNKVGIPMFGRIKSNFNFYKNRDRIPMF